MELYLLFTQRQETDTHALYGQFVLVFERAYFTEQHRQPFLSSNHSS